MVEALLFGLSQMLTAKEQGTWQILFWSPARRAVSVR